ncbi:MAG TPA: oxygenase MpaB family protein [Algoriphagus sp.]|nr:oxygenase MpaB family protein [Algoriphagus sp.]
MFDQLRQKQDELADRTISALIQNPEWIRTINSWKIIPTDLPKSFSIDLKEFFEFYQNRFSSFDTLTLKKGQDFFDQKGDLYVALLGFYSLPYCYAFADGAEVLVRSKRILDSIGERLGETGSFVMEIFRPGAFISDQRAFLVCAKVRLIHAFSRYFILKHSQDWNSNFGNPVNQEDMLGTNLAFSQIVLRGLIKLGIGVSEKEHSVVLAYWKWIGELLGIDVEYWPETSKEAFELDKLLRKRHLKSSEAGRKLVLVLMNFYKSNISDPLVIPLVEDMLCFFLGKTASKVLGLSQNRKLEGELFGLMFKFSGWKNGGQKGFNRLIQTIEKQQKEQFGKVLKINLPEINRP